MPVLSEARREELRTALLAGVIPGSVEEDDTNPHFRRPGDKSAAATEWLVFELSVHLHVRHRHDLYRQELKRHLRLKLRPE